MFAIIIRQHEHDDLDLAIALDGDLPEYSDDFAGEVELKIRDHYDVTDFDRYGRTFTAIHEDHGEEVIYYFAPAPLTK